MEKENLLKMADHIETIPQGMFDMGEYRIGDEKTHECSSVGDIIGHCTILDSEPLPRFDDGDIDFETWAKKFTGLDYWENEWLFLFSEAWVMSDNTPTGAAKRIRYFVENGVPENWEKIMYGVDPLPY